MILISPSQIGTFIMCNSRWGWDKIEKVPRKAPSKAMAFGTEAHLTMEQYGRSGDKPSYSMATPAERAALTVIREGRCKTQTPGVFHEGMGVDCTAPATDKDGKFSLALPHISDNVAFHGFIDYMDATDPKHVHVRDYKFQSPRTPLKDLSKDAQALIYSYYAFSVFKDCEAVTFSHEIGRKTNPPSYECNEISFFRGGPVFRAGMASMFSYVKDMLKAHKLGTVSCLEKDIKACWAFGKRCEFHGRCFPQEKEEDVVFYV